MLRTRVRAGPVAGFVLSALFAALFTIVGSFDLLLPALAPTLGAATPVTLRIPYGPRITRERDVREGRAQLSFEHSRVVVPRGTVLREVVDAHRAAFAYESTRRPPSLARLLSNYAIYFIVCMILMAYLRRFGQSRVRLLRAQAGLLVLALGQLALAKFMLVATALPEFWMPMAALPLWVALAFDRRTAFLFEVVVAFFAASLLRFDIVLFATMLVRGMAATLFFFNRKAPKQMIVAGALAGVAGTIAFVALTIVFEGTFDTIADLRAGLGSNVVACLAGGLTAGVMARILHEPAELVMGHVSRDRLLDLTDLEQPLLKKMAAEAPGSWEHARAMANLAEAAAAAIGADALLTRVGAYYHDLGKTVQSKYFVENLAHGERSPHDDLEPDVSADAIMAHVVLGTKILRDGRIPEPVVEFAFTHHGTQAVEYFWNKCLEQGNPKGLTKEYFRYPGMKPQTKETAILMLVDSIEAASRTIWPPEHAKFEEMIQRVVFQKLSAGQLDESGLSLEDLRVMTSRMAATLVNMYHGRIKYPWQQAAAKAKGNGETPAPGEAGKAQADDRAADDGDRPSESQRPTVAVVPDAPRGSAPTPEPTRN